MNTDNSSPAKKRGDQIRVLVHNRPNALTQRGGDTVVMEYLMKGLERQGVNVTLDLEGRQNPGDFEIVHIFNFATPDLTRAFADRAWRAQVPYVVTTLNEDVPTFHNQSLAVASSLVNYVRSGQSRDWYMANRVDPAAVPPSGRFENGWTASHAAALFSNGAGESALLQREYPGCKVVEIKLGYEIPAAGRAEDFVEAYGVKDFVFCVGRLESRKNQLMLLKALEDSDLKVVLAAGGFTYQPEYADAVRSFRRKGRTLVLDRLSPEMLASAYAAAKVHVLPSWYELPGLVSLEAAYYGCNVVATERGTTADYFGPTAFYCDPGNPASVQNAVIAAYYSPFREETRAAAISHTWEDAARKTFEAYCSVLGIEARRSASSLMRNVEIERSGAETQSVFDFSISAVEFQDVLERGELAARNRDYNIAHDFLEQASQMNPGSARALRARGAVYLAENNIKDARVCLEKASDLDPNDPKTLSGLAMCECICGDPAKAYPYLLRALDMDPPQLVAILQLVECAYALNRYDDLERVLRKYVGNNPDDMEMLYCLAGCVYKMGNTSEALRIVEALLERTPGHIGSLQLREMIQSASAQDSQATASESAPEDVLFEPMHDIEMALIRLEEAKRRREFGLVKNECGVILARPQLSSPHARHAKLLLAEIHALEGNSESADRLYDEVLQGNPSDVRAISGKAAMAASRGDFETAEALFVRANGTDPKYDLALAGLGLCAYWRKDYEISWDRYLAALAANPENSRALLGLIELGYRLGRLPEVERAISEYLSMHPADLNFIYSLAGCLYAQNKLDSALEEVERILVFDGGHKHANELREIIVGKVSAGAGQAAQADVRRPA